MNVCSEPQLIIKNLQVVTYCHLVVMYGQYNFYFLKSRLTPKNFQFFIPFIK